MVTINSFLQPWNLYRELHSNSFQNYWAIKDDDDNDDDDDDDNTGYHT